MHFLDLGCIWWHVTDSLLTDTDAAACWILPVGGWPPQASVDIPNILPFVLHLLHPGLLSILQFLFSQFCPIIWLISLSDIFWLLTMHSIPENDWWVHQGLLQNEYVGVTFPSTIPKAPPISAQVTLQNAFQAPDTMLGKWVNVLILAVMAIGYRVLVSVSFLLFQAVTFYKHKSLRRSQDE